MIDLSRFSNGAKLLLHNLRGWLTRLAKVHRELDTVVDASLGSVHGRNPAGVVIIRVVLFLIVRGSVPVVQFHLPVVQLQLLHMSLPFPPIQQEGNMNYLRLLLV